MSPGNPRPPESSAEERARKVLRGTAALFQSMAESATLPAEIAAAAGIIATSLAHGGCLITCGNGGSAADAQHIAAELGGRFYRVRPGVPAVALTVNSSMLTAIGNDFGFDEIFSRQLEAIGRPGDVLLAISTSGNSANVLKAAAAARDRGLGVIGLTGAGGGKLRDACDLLLAVPSGDTPRIQEGHIAIGHLLCELVEATLFPAAGPA